VDKSISNRIQILKTDTSIPCTRPWTSIEERSLAGDYRICCFINADLGTIDKKSDRNVLDLWNGPTVEKIRRFFAGGAFHRFCPPDCPVLFQKAEIEPDSTDFYEYDSSEYDSFSEKFRENRERVISAILHREIHPDIQPLRLKLHPTNTCNLRCRMCMQDKEDRVEIGNGYYRNLSRLMPYLEELIIFGGEPFACRVTKDIIFGETMRENPQIHISTITNGTLLDASMQERLKSLRLGWFSFSLDSCTEKTYESIRVNAKYAATFRNIESFVKKRDTGEIRIRDIDASFVIQKVNYSEIPRFVEFAHNLRIKSSFSLVTGFHELYDRMDEVRECVEAGIARADELGTFAAARQLASIHRQLPQYGEKLKKLKYFYRLLDRMNKDRVIFFLRKHNRLRLFLKKIAGIR
jgi:pyruvate-formate lyase-activating enzyme